MELQCSDLLTGVIIESTTESITGPYLYSHTRRFIDDEDNDKYETLLNKFTKVPILGSIGGVIRIALSIFHIIGHAFAYAITRKKGHKYHAIAGLCHSLRGLIESIPVIGQIFANIYGTGDFSWWMIKMYNPKKPDNFDKLLNKTTIDYLDVNLRYIRA